VAIAVPVLSPNGSIAAAVAVHAPASRASVNSCMDFLPALQRAAATIALTMHPAHAKTPAARRRRAAS